MTPNIEPFSALNDIETFNPRIFEGTSEVPQDVCNFVLALACIYNDYRDIIMAFHYLDYLQPSLPVEESREWGEFNGLKFHLMRLHISLVHELLKLIERSNRVVHDPYLQSIVSRLDALGRRTWNTLVKASSGNANTNLGKIFLKIRNKVAFHYDPNSFYLGYRNWFLNTEKAKKPYISLGKLITEERYYFAEASAQSYFDSRCASEQVKLEQVKEISTSLGPAISQIINTFISQRRLEL